MRTDNRTKNRGAFATGKSFNTYEAAKAEIDTQIQEQPICFAAIIKNGKLYRVLTGSKLDYLQKQKALASNNVLLLMTNFGHGE